MIEILGAFFLGLVGGANPGPVLAASFTEALRKGFLKSVRVIVMAMVAESIVAAFVLTLFFSFDIPQTIFYVISLAGAAVLVWLAVQIWKIKEIGGEGEVFSFWKIFLLIILSGPFWVFWITICVPQAFLLKEKIAGGQFLFLLLFELGWLFSTLILTFLFSRFRTLLTQKNFVSPLFKLFALILLFFAVKLAVTSIDFLL